MSLKQSKIFKVGLTYFILILAFITLRIISSFGLLSFLGDYANYTFSLIAQIGIMLCIPLFFYSAISKQKTKQTAREFGFKKIGINAIIICIIMGVLVYLLNIGVSSFFNGLVRAFGFSPRSGAVMTEYPIWMLFVNIFISAVLPAVCEEVAHRGMLLKGLKGLGIKKAVLYSSILFGLMHLNIEQFFYATIIGLLLAEITIISKSIFPAMIIHFMNNALATFSTFAYVNGLKFGNIDAFLQNFISNTNFFVLLIVITLVIAVILILLFYLARRLFLETAYRDYKKAHKNNAKNLLKKTYLIDVENTKNEVSGGRPNVENMKSLIDEGNKLSSGPMVAVDLEFPEKCEVKLDKYSKLFLISCFVVGAIVTLFTFIWGVI